MQKYYYDVLILGSGAAGLTLALELSDANIAIISKDKIEDTASYKAQGGIAAVIDSQDDVKEHIHDTTRAGDGLCDLKAVEFFVKEAPTAIQWLTNQGVIFDKTVSNTYDLLGEGGHCRRRVLHIQDETGKYIIKRLFSNIFRNKHIRFFSNCIAIDLLVENRRCVGCLVFDSEKKQVNMMMAKSIVLATGGCSVVYDKMSNATATGDGIAMAYRANCRIKHMEFCQFHPTCFRSKNGIFLISETLRGEGAQLKNPSNGERFMFRYDSRGELASRDIVARAMTIEMDKHCLTHINLDISHRSREFIQSHFPKIYHVCLQNNIDITQQSIPVFPAAHYTCGGVAVNLVGQTDIENLFAIGEVACTGFHGANRLASNSLLECVVSGLTVAKKINNISSTLTFSSANFSTQPYIVAEESKAAIAKWRRSIQKIMWSCVGIVRRHDGLLSAKNKLFKIKTTIENIFPPSIITHQLITLRNLAQVACLIVESAISRKENCGAHYNIDNERHSL